MLIKHSNKYIRVISFAGLFCVSIFALFYCFDYLLQISFSVFISSIKQEFALSYFQISLIGSAFFIGYVFLQIPGGYLIDKYGAKRIAVTLSFVCCIGLLIFATSYNYYSLLFARLLIGVGSSIAFLCCVYALSNWLPKSMFAIGIGTFQALAGLGSVLGQTPISVLSNSFSWREITLMLFVACLVFLLIFAFVVGRTKIHVTAKSNSSTGIFKSIAHICKNKQLIYISVLSFIAWSPVASLAGFWFIPYMKSQYHQSDEITGLVLLVFWLAVIISSLSIPLISHFIRSHKKLYIYGFSIQAVAIVVLLFSDGNMYANLISLGLLGVIAPLQGFCMLLAKYSVEPEVYGISTGLVNMTGALSGGLIQLIIGFLLTYVLYESSIKFTLSFSIYLILALIALYIAIFKLKETY